MTGVLAADGKGNVHMDSAGSIARAVLDWDAGWNDLTIERNIFGSTDSQQIADVILSFVRQHLGRAAMRCLFYETSMGCVLGLSLDDGRTIALKAQPPGLQLDRLLAAQRVQTHLADHGFPAPRPILPPTQLVQGYATVEEWSARGEYRNPHEPRIRTALATLLAAIARLGTHLDTSGLRRTGHGKHDEGVLWGTPHSTLFDFVATSGGAEWIDALAWQAQPLLRKPVGEDALGHSDWKAAHVRFDGEEATAVYDWDSVVYDT